MPWPTPQDYQEAMQNPQVAFADAELQTGRAEENQLGLPRPISGGFASVYKVVGPGRTWAVRCFLKEFHDQQKRYAAISDRLTRAALPFTVGFDFLKQGIRVRGNWYPVLKMEWVQGESLVRFISNNLQSSRSLLTLGVEIVQVARTLHDAGIAHGDLQHGNILVVNGKPKLIDYDGMYVPPLHGLGSHEVGHPNYQHPGRKEHDFGPGLDNFSVWVIYLSLLALSVRPNLWGQFKGGDECLLFRRSDFERPDRSPVLRELERLPDGGLQPLATMFRSLLALSPLQVPLIDLRAPLGSGQRAPRPGADWLRDHVPAQRPPSSVAPTPAQVPSGRQPPAIIDASWLIGNWNGEPQRLPSPSFQNSLVPERLILLATSCLVFSALALVTFLAGGLVAPLILWVLACVTTIFSLLVNLVYWKYRHANDGGVARARSLSRQIHDLEQSIQEAVTAVAGAERGREAELQRMAKIEKELRMQLNVIAADEWRLLGETKMRTSSQLGEVARLRTANLDNENKELSRLRVDVSQAVADLDRRIARLPQVASEERESALKRMQEQHLQQSLQTALLAHATLGGIGHKLRERLIAAGFWTAAHIDWKVFQVPDIGDKRGQELLHWRESVEQRARATAPKALPPDELNAIRARYQQQLELCQAQKESDYQRLSAGESAIRQKYRDESANLDRREAAIKEAVPQEEARIRNQQSSLRRQREDDLARLAQEQKTSQVLANLSRTIAENRQRLAELNWEKARIRKEVDAMARRLTLCDYVRRIFFLR
jgi:serine/threonine protein kinase